MRRIYVTKSVVLIAFLCWGIGYTLAGNLKSATAISEVFGDGAKITTVVLNYPEKIDGSKLGLSSFHVDGREIIKAYTSSTPEKGLASEFGEYVVIELKSGTVLKPVSQHETRGKMQGPVAGQKGMHGPGYDPKKDKTEIDSVIVEQCLPIFTLEGEKISPDGKPIVAKSNRTLIADDFKQLVFHDAKTGINLSYNLFIPKDATHGKKHPLVLFMHDAGGAGKGVKHPLLQGNGATVWASPEWQAKHPCYVLAPRFERVTVDDDYNTTPDIDVCLDLVEYLVENYDIDCDRVYTTGQSMGCMMSYVMMIRRPQLFASAFLVAGQWNPAVLAPLAKKNLWLISCEGDVKSSEGVANAIAVWKKNGALVVEQTLPLDTTAAARNEEVHQMLERKGNIYYSRISGGSHNNTWRVAYSIEGIRDWLFEQKR